MRQELVILILHCPVCKQAWQAAVPVECQLSITRWAMAGDAESGICPDCLRHRWAVAKRKARMLGLIEDELEAA